MKVRCSKLARHMVCAGYIFLDLPNLPSTDAAKEGTAAGEYLERLLLGKPLNDIASNGVFIDEDMKFYITDVYNEIMSRASSELLCEQRIDWQTRSGICISGQYDVAFIDKNETLCIEDLKYGWGLVEVEKNWQLLGYAIGEVIRRGRAFENVSLKIHQPRPHHEDGSTREWLLSYSELLDYKEMIEARMLEIKNGRRDFQTSDKCRFCEGAGEACPAFNRAFYSSVEVSTGFIQDTISDETISAQLDLIKRAEEILKIKKDSLTELGTSRIKEGRIIPGYMQNKRYGNRVWKKGISPESIKLMTGVDATETKFMTPAKVEKLGGHKDIVSQLTEKKFIGLELKKKDASKEANKIFGNINPKEK